MQSRHTFWSKPHRRSVAKRTQSTNSQHREIWGPFLYIHVYRISDSIIIAWFSHPNFYEVIDTGHMQKMHDHWKQKVVMLITFSSLVAAEAVRMTTSDAASDEKVVNRTTFWFQWWHHQLEIFSALLGLSPGISPVTGEFPPQKPVMRSFDVPLIYTWTNGWANHRDTGSLRRHHSQYDVTVMW